MHTPARLEDILNALHSGDISVADALNLCQKQEDLGFATIDHDRRKRCGFPEVIFAESKTPEHNLQIARALLKQDGFVFLTRVSQETRQLLTQEWQDAEFNPLSRTMIIGKLPTITAAANSRKALIISAGTSDLPIAQEAAVTARVMGCNVSSICDVGVAGIHRILARQAVLKEAAVIIVTAGMEGALPSVVAGLVDAPVIGVPTSVGYGASFKGIAALLGMLNSCANGVAVVNIDNGFGAGCMAARIIKNKEDNNEYK